MLRRFPFMRTLATVCILSLQRLAVTCWLLLPLILQPVAAQSRPLIPLHTDPSLSASIVVRGQFQSLIVDETRPLTLRVWAADFSPNEQVDFEQLESRAFSALELPEEAGWGLFAPIGNYLEIQVQVTDSQGRLGRVEFRRWDTWQLVGSIWANAYRTEASGVFSIPSELRELVAEVLNDTGRVLARIAVDVGKFDRVVPVLVRGVFEPLRFDPSECAHFQPADDDVYGASGHPYTPPGAKTTPVLGAEVTGPDRSYTVMYKDFTNDNSGTVQVYPPHALRQLCRRRTIANTVNLGRSQVADPQSLAQMVQEVNAAAQEDPSSVVLPVEALPYSEGCARWHVTFIGQATAVLAIPYEPKKSPWHIHALVAGIAAYLGTQKGFLSTLAVEASNRWLQSEENQQASRLKPGQVIAWGDVYSVLTESGKDVPRWANLTQEWTVKICALYEDGSTQEIEGDFEANATLALTNPAPPLPASIRKKAPIDGTTVLLAKGWEWALKPTAPGGQETKVRVPGDGSREVILYVHMRRAGGTPPEEQ